LDKKVSFIIVNWNGKKFLKECIESILNQTYKNFEIIFVDNGSEDNSVKFVEENYDLDYIVELNENQGFAKANNVGYKYANGDYIALINNDVVLDSKWLENAIKNFNYNNQVGIVATRILQYNDRNLTDSLGVEYLPFGAMIDYREKEYDTNFANQTRYAFGACAASALYNKKMLEHIGLFHNIYFAYFEDSDLNFRAQLFGYDCIYEPDSISYHHGSGTGVKNSEFYVEKGRRNIEYFYFINMQGYLIYKYFLFHFIYEFINFLYFISIGRGLSFLKGKLEFLFNLKKVLNIRSDIKKKLKSEGKWNNLKEVELKFKKMGLVKSKFKKALNSYRKKIFK
jgi:hypothetical protein